MKRNWSSSDNRVAEERFLRRYIRHFNIDFEEARHRLTNTSVQIHPLVNVDISTFKSFLESLGIPLVSKAADIVIPISETYQASTSLDDCVSDCASKGVWCLPIKTGVISYIGPFIEPGSGFCWPCFKLGLQRQNPIVHSMESLSLERGRGASDVHFPSLVSNRWFAFAARILLHHLLRTSTPATTEKHLFVINSATGEEEVHPVLRWMRCTNCIESERTAQKANPAINLDVTIDAITSQASQESLDAALHALQRITSPYTGVLSTLVLTPAQSSEPGFYSAVSRHPLYNRLPSELREKNTERAAL